MMGSQQKTFFFFFFLVLLEDAARKVMSGAAGSETLSYVCAHCRGLRRDVLGDGGRGLGFGSRFGLQDVGLDHFEVAVLGGHVAVLERDQDGASVFPREPLLRLQSRVGTGRVRVQVVLEQIRLGVEGEGGSTGSAFSDRQLC